MDRSFLAVRHLLGRLVPSNDNNRQEAAATPEKAKRRRGKPKPEAELQEDWIRLEL